MEKFRTKSMRYLAFALIAAMISVFGLGAWDGIKAIADVEEEGEEEKAPVSFDSEKDTVVTDFIFYTTDKVSNKVPAANKWLKTSGGKVDVSNLTKGKKLYFANSTTPSLDEIVAVVIPASPVLSTAKYDSKKTTFEEKFIFKTNIKLDGKTSAVDVPKARIQIKLNDNSTWKYFDEVMANDADLQALQKQGATLYARIAPTTSSPEYDENANAWVFVDTGIAVDADENEEPANNLSIANGESITRYGVAKTFKIAKKSVGPAVKIDYANHSMQVNKNWSYITTDDTYATDKGEWNKDDKKNVKVYFNNVDEKTEYYGVKTDTSLTTYLLIPPAVPFAATNSTVTIQGGFEEDATLSVTANVDDESTKKRTVAYQYAIVDLNDTHKDLIKEGKFDYEKSLSFTGKAKITWKKVSVTIKANETTGTAAVTLKKNDVKGKQVLVRKAAVGTEYSSQVVVFNAPTGNGLATYDPDKMPEVNCWTMLTQADYGSGFVGNNMEMKFCANISGAEYDPATNTIKFNVVAGAGISKVENVEVKAKVGKAAAKACTLEENAVADKDENPKVQIPMGEGMSKEMTANNKIVTIDLSKVGNFQTDNAVAVTISIPAGYATNKDGVATVAKTITINLDNKAPKATAPTFNNGTVTITVDEDLEVAETAKIEAKSGENDIITFTEIKFNKVTKKGKTTRTITANYTVKNTDVEKVTLAVDGITDKAGNKIDASALKDLANPGYVKPSEEQTTSEAAE